MSFVARIRRALGLIAVALAMVAFLSLWRAGAAASGDVCANFDDYGECVSEWVEKCLEVDETAVRLDQCKGPAG